MSNISVDCTGMAVAMVGRPGWERVCGDGYGPYFVKFENGILHIEDEIGAGIGLKIDAEGAMDLADEIMNVVEEVLLQEIGEN